ncbi:hypothetical protein GCM10025868_08340 [Angustibacter aerolatus]|uniref:Radical SAM core domain-containing protein n=1 Tax=Angustibacter aerolatus TaxID=1162965 RepID=A0ABQ6JDU0_9ACTN|nr:radical SAM protein [Angustibacter aerolatus]GMA85584.1 hypothetical protein GCM10025868_08340 [Angustibacter aerolatus]
MTQVLPTLLTPVSTREADHGETVKTLWRLFDGALVESVLMHYRDRSTICISSQAGCGMNCPFCATGQAGLTRNMSTGEIVDQVVWGARQVAERHGGDRRRLNVVFMGMGEALANYKAAIGAIRRLTDAAPDGLGLSARGVTMSTVGLVPAIDKPGRGGRAGDARPEPARARRRACATSLVPINTRWKVGEALDAARRYFETTGRRVSIEYALIRDVNDQAWRADLLGKPAERPRPRLGARQPDPAEPHAGVEVDGERPARRARVRRGAAGARRADHDP